MIPNRLENATVYGKGQRLYGIADVELPKFEYDADAFKPLGVAGELEVISPANIKALSMKLKFRTVSEQSVELLTPQTKELEVYGAVSAYDPNQKQNTIKKVRVFAKVSPKSNSLGKVEAGKTMDTEVELSVQYFVLEIDGNKVVEYDPVNWVFSINGQNYLQDIKAALGL